jgi:hypothetical protein
MSGLIGFQEMLQILFEISFGKQMYIKKERAYLLLAAWKTVEPACFSSLLGHRAESEFSLLLLAPAWAGPGTTAARALPSWSR